MARKIEEIVLELEATKASRAELNAFNSTSKTAIWRLMFYVVAVAIWTLESLFDLHLSEVEQKLTLLKPHSAEWYKNVVLSFRYGHALVDGQYSDVGYTEEQILASKIVTQCVVIDNNSGDITIKVAKDSGATLTKLSVGELTALNAYIMKMKDAGVAVATSSLDADNLKAEISVYVDPLQIDLDGYKIGSGVKPIEQAIINYLLSLPFNSELTRMDLTDAIQGVEGVKVVEVLSISAKQPSDIVFEAIPIRYVSFAGYMKFEPTDLIVNYLSYV